MLLLNADVTPNEPTTDGEHRNFYQVMLDFWIEIFDFFKYIFYDLLLGKGA